MISTSRGWLSLLQLGLLISAVGWGVSFYFTLVSWETATRRLNLMGAGFIEYQPLLDYWLKMASSVFGCIGLASALAAFRPHAFVGLIRLLGPFHFLIAVVLAVSAYHNQLTPTLHPTFIPDISFCLLSGTLIQLPLLQKRATAQVVDSTPV